MIVACTLAAGLAKFQPQRISVILFPPVSERDQAGVEELESQTVALLSFREIAKPVFDAQVAFNLLASYGPESKSSLTETRSAVARDVAAYLSRARARARNSIGASARVLRVCFCGVCGARFADVAGAIRVIVRKSRGEDCRAGRRGADEYQRGGGK